jgi:hypothetical protein
MLASLIIGAHSTRRSNQRFPRAAAPNQDSAAHRICKPEQRRRTIGQNDVPHESLKIDVIVGEIGDVPLATLAQHTIGQPLATPVESRDRKAARGEITHDFKIFFDELDTSLEDGHRPLRCDGGGQRPNLMEMPSGSLEHSPRRLRGPLILQRGRQVLARPGSADRRPDGSAY